MRECSRPECDQWTDDQLCYFHAKKEGGLFDVPLSRPIDPLSAEGLALIEASRELGKTHDPRRCRRCRRGNKRHS